MDIVLLGIFVVLLGLLFVAIGAAVVWMSASSVQEARRSRSWPAVPALVLSSEMEVRQRTRADADGSYSVFHPSIRYSYEFAGTAHEGTRVRFGNQERLSESVAQSVLARYPAGAEAIAHVDPDMPSQAILDRNIPTVTWASMAFGVAIAAGGIIFTGWAVAEFFL